MAADVERATDDLPSRRSLPFHAHLQQTITAGKPAGREAGGSLMDGSRGFQTMIYILLGAAFVAGAALVAIVVLLIKWIF
jgi:hypothetical protein